MKTLRVQTKDFLKKLPKTDGVYVFKNRRGEIIYVGRAASLKTRVSSYFPSTGSASSGQVLNYGDNYGGSTSIVRRPIEQFINEIVTISYKKTSNLLEAAVLENNLIKKYLPKYNVKEKDQKSFVYLFFDMKTDFPKPIIIRGRDLGKYSSQKSESLGPYQSYHTLKNILLVARKLYSYSTCAPNTGKSCFHKQINLCPGICIGEIPSKEYKKKIRKLISFLKSKYPKTAKKKIDDIALMPENPSISFRANKLKKIEGLVPNRAEGYDISHFQKGQAYGSIVVFEDGKPQNSKYRLFKIKKAKTGDDPTALKEIIERRLRHKEWPYPNLIVVDGGRAQVNTVVTVLKKVGVHIPVIGISKSGRHAQSTASKDVLIFQAGLKKSVRELLTSQKKFFQQVRNEAHRFSIKALRQSQIYAKRK